MHGGFVEVKDNQVIMLADEAELAAEIDVEAARRAESDGQRRRVAGRRRGRLTEAAADALRWAQVRLEAAGPILRRVRRRRAVRPRHAIRFTAGRSPQTGRPVQRRAGAGPDRHVRRIEPSGGDSARPRTPNRV